MTQDEQKAVARRLSIANTEDANQVIQEAMTVSTVHDAEKVKVPLAHNRAMINFS
jgi:hypothetical protein